jgi:RNA polymerase sigma factor (sigma-70 family)
MLPDDKTWFNFRWMRGKGVVRTNVESVPMGQQNDTRGCDAGSELERLFPGDSEMAGRMRAFDWSSTDLGDPAGWPEDLRVAAPSAITERGGRTSRCVRIGAGAMPPQTMGGPMSDEQTTAVVQRYLDELDGDSPAEPIVRALLDRAVRRLHLLCATLLNRSYPRLARPPLNLHADELLGAVTERLLKALREARPRNVRQLFALANQHMRWELNDLARRLDERPAAAELSERLVPAPASSASGLSPDGLRMLRAIEDLPEDEREVFDLVRIQGMTQAEAAQLLGVSAVTVKRRLSRGLQLLAEQLADLRPGEGPPGST